VSFKRALCEHWPEYLIEGWALGSLMISVGSFVTVFESPKSPVYTFIPNSVLRSALLAVAIGMTITLLIQSSWGKRSGAHMNPAITLAFLRLGRIHRWDALFFIFAQTIGGMLGVVVVVILGRHLFTDPPVHYAVTIPGSTGEAVAFIAEMAISFVLMTTILAFVASPRLIRFTGLAVGCVVAFFIIVEGPFSGASMNPARTLASAVPGMVWQHVWIYLLAPTLGMLIAAQRHLYARTGGPHGCAKLLHPSDVRCIHCGFRPAPHATDAVKSGSVLRKPRPDAAFTATESEESHVLPRCSATHTGSEER
jgi:aquaporin Z